ncbi:MAG: hypothetical protein WCP09_02690 [Candidatus Taylorbacteria bacterium]
MKYSRSIQSRKSMPCIGQAIGLDSYKAPPRKRFVSNPLSVFTFFMILVIIVLATIFLAYVTHSHGPLITEPFDFLTN